MPERYCPECLDLASLDGDYCDRCGERIVTSRVDLDEVMQCPMGCGRTTEDPYGGPCSACWDAAPTEGRG